MRRFIKGKYILFIIGLILLLFVINKVVVDTVQKPVKMVEAQSIWQDVEIQKSHLTANSIVTWDNTNLKLYDLQGEIIDEVIGNGYYTNVYFFDDEIGVLDKQLNVLYFYNPTGSLKEKIQLSGSVYSIFKKKGYIYIHRKDEKGDQRLETISKLEGEGKESPIYETDKFIINFEVDEKNIYVSEITAENYAYKSILNVVENNESRVFDFGNETILDIRKFGDRIVVISNKNLYSIQDNERDKVELNNFKDFIFEDSKILVLYNNKLVKFNSDLSINKTYEVGISSSGILEHDGSYFIYGPTDIVGYIGQKREFKKSFDSIIYDISSNDKAILVSHKYNVELYYFDTVKEETNN